MWRKKFYFERPKDIPFKRRRIKAPSQKRPVFVNPYFFRPKPARWLVFLVKFYPVFFGLGLLIGLLYFLFYSSYFRMNTVVVEGNSDVTYDAIRYVVNLSFVERRWLVFRQSNFFVWDKKVTYDRLWEKFPFEQLRIEKKFPRSIYLKVKEKIPGFVYMNGSNAYYTDLAGTITQTVDAAQLKPAFPKIQDENSRAVNIREQVLSTEIISAILYLEKELGKRVPLPVQYYALNSVQCTDAKEVEKEVVVPIEEGTNSNVPTSIVSEATEEGVDEDDQTLESGEYKVVKQTEIIEEPVPCDYVSILSDIKVVFGDWAIYFDAQENIADQLMALQLVLTQSIEDPTRLEYIDVRIPSRVFYK